jgi:hypothetical protein
LRISVTQIAFENTAALRIPPHGSEGTGRNAHFAADADVMVDADAVQRFIAANCIFGTDCHAGSIFTLLATHGDINAYLFPFNNMNTG